MAPISKQIKQNHGIADNGTFINYCYYAAKQRNKLQKEQMTTA